ncbi:MAG: hypothetical protein HOM68_13525 [Gemmatimonadetes bacterium]|nr:hypothetical protein [Gemmatimonadota bacterium]MBT4609609.1 hypothetical protein [Gemmatimonadota bacterium]MBT5057557.1 hypothetical protein [Gemmatimonadota bacterium]MBT5146292.1 hypothetical protein [Gemmatimonadota bacterium]MBT5591215.1 hypothetical protein [Gemmatimonadota bacterium]
MLTPLFHRCLDQFSWCLDLPRRCLDLLRLLLVFSLLAAPAYAGDGGSEPGRLDLVALGFEPVVEPTVDLTIDAAQFAIAALVAAETDADLAALLGNVEAFCLRQYSPPDAATFAAAQVLPAAIVADGWQLVQAETQGSRQVTVHLKLDGLVVGGLAVIAIDADREVSVANVVGNIQPAQLATLGLPLP